MFSHCAPKLLSVCLLTAGPAFAQAPSAHPLEKNSIDLPLQLPGLVLDDAVGTVSSPWRWDSGDWSRLALGTAAVVGTAILLDRPVQKAILRNGSESLTRWSNNLAPIGNQYSFLAAGGFYAYGLLARNDEVRATGADTLAAMAVAGLALIPLKYGVGRARPDANLGDRSFKPLGTNRDSFPSGHTTFAFTAAAAITEHYPETWVQVTAYGLATLTGLARVEQNVHWTSDVLAGALIGTTIGKLVTRMNQRRRFGQQSKVRFVLEPDLALGYQGLRAGLVF